VVDRCAEVLAASPDPVLPLASLGSRRPASGADVPSVAISLTVDTPRGIGLGRFIRAGDVLAQSTVVVEVHPGPDTFSDDLGSLEIAPLPLKQNPASTTADLGPDDVQVRNLTDPSNPVAYRFVDRPTGMNEYLVDAATTRIVFGAPQTAGEKLEVTHWTVTWRDDVRGDRYRGLLTFEVWAQSASEVDGLARKLQGRLDGLSPLTREKGFSLLRPTDLDPAQNVLYQPATGTAFPVWKQRLTYRFVFEYEEGGELSSAGPIKRIDVDVARPRESFVVP
jgi:hypothetical protein